MRLGVVISARDEEATIGAVISDVKQAAGAAFELASLVVSNNGSRDRTAEVAKAHGADVISADRPAGLARAFARGVKASLTADIDYVAHIDADGQYSAKSISDLATLTGGTDLLIGDRLAKRPAGMSDFRFAWNGYLTGLTALLAGCPLRDAQSGLRLFTRELAAIILITSDFTYTQEQIIRSARAGFTVRQEPVPFGPRVVGHSRLVKTPLFYLARLFPDLEKLAMEYQVDLETVRFLPAGDS